MGVDLRLVIPALLLLAGCAEGSRTPRPPEVVATINEEPLTVYEYRAALHFDDLENDGLSPRSLEELQTARRQILKSLIDRKLLAQAARRKGISVTEEEVERALLRLRADWPGGSFDRLLLESQLPLSDLRDQIREKLVTERLFVEEVFSRIAVTDEEVAVWIRAHPDTIDQPERVRAAQIVVKTEEEAERLLGEIRKGAAFDELARRYSLSPDAKAGGDLGYFARGQMPPQFETTCFSLGVNRVSDVIASPYGYHIFKVLDRQSAQKLPAETIRLSAENRLRREKEALAQEEYVSALRNSARIVIDESALLRLKGNS